MRFQPRPNSLFAILLRKPWWVSLLVAGVIALVSFALVPPDLAPFAAASGLPFVVIAVIALKNQWGRPSPAEVERVAQAVSAMAWEPFSARLEQAFVRDGWQVERLHGAADLRLRKGGRHVLVAARRWKAARQGEDALLALQALCEAQEATGAMFITLGEVGPRAHEVAAANGIAIVQHEGLAQLLRGQPLP